MTPHVSPVPINVHDCSARIFVGPRIAVKRYNLRVKCFYSTTENAIRAAGRLKANLSKRRTRRSQMWDRTAHPQAVFMPYEASGSRRAEGLDRIRSYSTGRSYRGKEGSRTEDVWTAIRGPYTARRSSSILTTSTYGYVFVHG